jgi:hypothetical protein
MLGIGTTTTDSQTDSCELLMDSDLQCYFIGIEFDNLNLMKLASKSVHCSELQRNVKYLIRKEHN